MALKVDNCGYSRNFTLPTKRVFLGRQKNLGLPPCIGPPQVMSRLGIPKPWRGNCSTFVPLGAMKRGKKKRPLIGSHEIFGMYYLPTYTSWMVDLFFVGCSCFFPNEQNEKRGVVEGRGFTLHLPQQSTKCRATCHTWILWVGM